MSKKLLLADDSITIQKVVQIIFAHEDYELTITDNGDSALAKALEIKPDLVMADVYMPGRNGYELTRAIRQDPDLQQVPVLLLTGSFEAFDKDKASSCNADDWIEKPFESQALIDKVAALLSVVKEAPAAEPETAAIADNLDDVAGEPLLAEPVVEDTFDTTEEPVAESNEPLTADFLVLEDVPTTEPDFDVFDLGDDEIMPLDDDDILDEECLEPTQPEQTLATWSRNEIGDEDIFAESAEETPAFAEEIPVVVEEIPVVVEEIPVVVEEIPVVVEEIPAFAEEIPVVVEEIPAVAEEIPAVTEEISVVAEESPVTAEETPVFEESFVESVPVEEPEAAAMVAAAEKASVLSEADIEKIIEKAVTKVVDKLAGSILERVAWEVVPDLAEKLIREEIRKIKDAAA